MNDDGYEMIQLAKSGDQRSAKKEKIKRDKICEKGMFLDEHETEIAKEQGVDGEERCEYQPCLVVACLEVENSIEQEHDKKKICLLFQD